MKKTTGSTNQQAATREQREKAINSSFPSPSNVLSQTMERRGFLFRAASVGIMAVTAPSLLAACEQLETESLSPTPTGTSFPSATPFNSNAVTATPKATPTVAPKATPTVAPTVAPTAAPTATPTATPVLPSRAPLSTEGARVSHLLRRAGFGASKTELAQFRKMGLQGTIDYLVDFDDIDDGELEARLAAQTFDSTSKGNCQKWWLQRMAYSKRPLQEKMTLFWHGILTSSFSKANNKPAMFEQNELFRREGMGRYDKMLKSVSRDPAMLIYLDSQSNRKKAPNENYSRELMELFTLGIGQYTEEDVQEAARSFTGWQLRKEKEFYFNKNQHDFGIKTFLGQQGSLDGDDVVDIIMQQPVASEYIVRRLWEFFAYAEPEQTVIARLAKVFRTGKTNIRPVVRAIFESEEFYSARAAQGLIKGPAEFTASAIRTLGITTVFAGVHRTPVERMGQDLFNPPDVAGWDGGIAWINSSTLMERVNLANTLVTDRKGNYKFDPQDLLSDTTANSEAVVDSLVDLLLGDEVSEATRSVLLEHAKDMGTSPAPSGQLVLEDEQLRSLVYLILASPDYQLA